MTASDFDFADSDEMIEAVDEALLMLGDGVMTLNELEGLLIAVCVCPDVIHPDEWLPWIWSVNEEIDDEDVAADPAAAQALITILAWQMSLAEGVERALDEDEQIFEPIYSLEDLGAEILWRHWLQGFEKGMHLRPDAWTRVAKRGGDATNAFNLLASLILLAEGDAEIEAELGETKTRDLLDNAPDIIPRCIEVLARARSRRRREPVRRAKVGRNERCPCGSGKKFKACCAA